MPKKDRLTVLKVITRKEIKFCLNEEEIREWLGKQFPKPGKHQIVRQIILDASAIVWYQQQRKAIRLFISDDAPQFKQVTKALGLCWVHEGRHYKRLNPVIERNRMELSKILKQFWNYYRNCMSSNSPQLAV